MAGRSWGLPAAPLPAGCSAREPRRRRCPFVPGQQPRAAPRASWGRHTSSHWFLFLFLFLTDDEGRGVVGRLSPEGSRAVPRAAPAGSLQSPGGREHYRVAFFFPLQSHVGFPTRCPGGRRRAGEGVSLLLSGPRPPPPPASSFARPWGGTCRTPAHEHFMPLCGEPAVAAGTRGFPPMPTPHQQVATPASRGSSGQGHFVEVSGFFFPPLTALLRRGRWPVAGATAGGRSPLLPVGTFLPAPTPAPVPRFLPGLSGGGTCTIQSKLCQSLFLSRLPSLHERRPAWLHCARIAAAPAARGTRRGLPPSGDTCRHRRRGFFFCQTKP